MPSEELQELMLLYVVDGLEPDSRDWVQRLLDAGDVDAQRAYAQATAAVACLPEALDPVEPPEGMRAALLGDAGFEEAQPVAEVQAAIEAEAEAQLEPEPEPDPVVEPEPEPEPDSEAAYDAAQDIEPQEELATEPGALEVPVPAALLDTTYPGSTPQTTVVERSLGAWPKLAILAAFILGLGLGAVVLMQVLGIEAGESSTNGNANADLQAVIDEHKTLLDKQQESLTRLQSQLAEVKDASQEERDTLEQTIEQQRTTIQQQTNLIESLEVSMSLLVGPGVQQAELVGKGVAIGSEGRLMWDPTTGQLRLLSRGLERLESTQTYQLWFIGGNDEPVSLGVFEVATSPTSTSAYLTTVPLVPNTIQSVIVSIEPAGGSPQPGPTGPVVMNSAPTN